MVEKTYQIIYGSNIIIRNPVELATLCVFYDQTFLPYASRESCRRHVGPGFFAQFPEKVAGKKIPEPFEDTPRGAGSLVPTTPHIFRSPR